MELIDKGQIKYYRSCYGYTYASKIEIDKIQIIDAVPRKQIDQMIEELKALDVRWFDSKMDAICYALNIIHKYCDKGDKNETV